MVAEHVSITNHMQDMTIAEGADAATAVNKAKAPSHYIFQTIPWSNLIATYLI